METSGNTGHGRKYLPYSVGILCCVVLIFSAGFLAARFSASPERRWLWLARPRRNPGDYEVQQMLKQFQRLVDGANSYIVENDGFIPADFYRALVDSGKVGSFEDFVFSDSRAARCQWWKIPPRVNPELRRNARGVLFWVFIDDVSETWACYFDGTWERETHDGRLGQMNYLQLGRKYTAAMHDAGFPSWMSVSEKREWIRENRDRLVWDDERRMYVPSKRSQKPE